MTRLKSQLGYRWHLFKRHHQHWEVVQADGGFGFCAWTDEELMHRFSRYWSEGNLSLRSRLRWNWKSAQETAKLNLRRFGLIVADRSVDLGDLPGIKLIWPRSVDLRLEMPTSWEAFWAGLGSSAKAEARRLRKAGFRFVDSTDRNRVKEFYTHQLVPSLRSVHGESAFTDTLEGTLRVFDHRGEFVEVWQGDEWVGGMLVTNSEDSYRLRRFGWRLGKTDLRREGIVAAMYLFGARRTIERKRRWFDLGDVPPILENGLMGFKSKWGAQLFHRKVNRGASQVVVDPSHADCRRFFSKNSLVLPNTITGKFDVLSERLREDVKITPAVNDCLGEWMDLAHLMARDKTGNV